MSFLDSILSFFKSRKELRENKQQINFESPIPKSVLEEQPHRKELNKEKNTIPAEPPPEKRELTLIEKLRGINGFKTIETYEEKQYTEEEKRKLLESTKPKPQGNIRKDGKPSLGIISITKKGEEVRSKAEKYIADFLFDKNIAYVYEKPTIVGNGIRIKLDFYLPESGLYLEFFGLPDLPEYREKMKLKMREYVDYGIKCIMVFPDDMKTGAYKQKILEKIERINKEV